MVWWLRLYNNLKAHFEHFISLCDLIHSHSPIGYRGRRGKNLEKIISMPRNLTDHLKEDKENFPVEAVDRQKPKLNANHFSILSTPPPPTYLRPSLPRNKMFWSLIRSKILFFMSWREHFLGHCFHRQPKHMNILPMYAISDLWTYFGGTEERSNRRFINQNGSFGTQLGLWPLRFRLCSRANMTKVLSTRRWHNTKQWKSRPNRL